MKENPTKNLVLSALFLAIGFVLPMLTGQIPAIGQVLLPMHIPVFLCGMICGWKYGASVGFLLPIFRSVLFSVPIMYPTAIAVAFEMSVYGGVSGVFFACAKKKTIGAVYGAMLPAMVVGRCVRAIAEVVLLGLQGEPFVWKAFVTGVVLHSTPGIVLQLVLVPTAMLALRRVETPKRK